MKMLRYLFAIVLVSGLTNVAKAGPAPPPGFQMVVVDPTVPLDLIQPVYTDDFTLDFPVPPSPAAGCTTGKDGQLPSGDTGYSACFTGINLTGKPLTSLEIELPTSIIGSSPNCSGAITDNYFSNVSCTSTNGGLDELFDFTGGDIVNATFFNSFCYFNPFAGPTVDCSSPAIFTIAIGAPGVNLDLPGGAASQIDAAGVTVIANAPEPSSILLMSTGVLSLGLFAAYRREKLLVTARPPTAATFD